MIKLNVSVRDLTCLVKSDIDCLQKSTKISFASLIVRTMPGPEVTVSTSVPLFLILVRNSYTVSTLFAMSKTESGSTLS